LRQAWVKNGKSHSISGNYRKYIRIDPEMRRAYREAENRPNLRILLYAALLLLAISIPAMVLTYRRRRQ
jgi:hypothetical protein